VVQDGVQQNQIALVTFADKTGLIPEEDTLLFNQNPVAQEIAAGGEIRSGYLETSNVNIAKQMVDMVRAQRAYETNIRTIRTVDTNMNQQVIQGFAAR
jgi:flagellar basal body rod protein FlgG